MFQFRAEGKTSLVFTLSLIVLKQKQNRLSGNGQLALDANEKTLLRRKNGVELRLKFNVSKRM